MRYGYWLPVFGGWLRNVPDEGMAATWDYVRRLAQRSEEIGYDLTLIAELFLNDIKGIDAPSLDAWSTAAALAAVTERLELMVAVRPTFHNPAILAKQAANIDHISNGRLALNVVSSWWKDEARRYGVHFDEHDDRYARTAEWLDVVDGAWREPAFSFDGRVLPGRRDRRSSRSRSGGRARPTIYAGGESEAAKTLIARDVRRVRHARRSARAHRAEDRRHASAPRGRCGLARRCSSAWRRTRSCATPSVRRSASSSASRTSHPARRATATTGLDREHEARAAA